MSWTTPRNWTTGELVTAAIMNTHVRDNQTFLHAPPAARVYNSTAQGISSGVPTALSFDSERYDNDSIHNTGVNPSRLYAKTAGKYLIVGNARLEATTASASLYLQVNGTTIIAIDGRRPAASAAIPDFVVTTIYDMAVNDYVELMMYHLHGSSRGILAAPNYSPEFMIQWQGA